MIDATAAPHRSCPKCGHALAGGELECPACGVILAKVRVPPATEAPPEATAEPPLEALDPSPEAEAEAVEPVPFVSQGTVDALRSLRPWLWVVVGYGLLFSSGMLLALLFVASQTSRRSGGLPALVALCAYSLIGFALTLPLLRAARILGRLETDGATLMVEQFARAQASFWRRAGLAVLVLLILIGLAFAFGLLAALGRLAMRS